MRSISSCSEKLSAPSSGMPPRTSRSSSTAELVLERPSWNTGHSSIFDSTCTSGGCRSLPLLLPPISLQSLEALCLRTFILSFLLLLNKEQQSLKQQEDAGRGSEKPLLQGFWNGALPSNHEKPPLRPRVDFPQTTCRFPQTTSRFPSDHVSFPSNHVSFPSDHESASLKPRKPPINGLKRELQGIPVRLW